MDIDLKSHRAHITYHQALNWHEAKIQRHLLARGDDRETMLGLALALLSHRLAFFDSNKTAPVLESAEGLGDYVLWNCADGQGKDNAVAVQILLEIAEQNLDDGMFPDSIQIELLIYFAGSLCRMMAPRGLTYLNCVRLIEKLSGRKFELEDLSSIAPRIYKHRVDNGIFQNRNVFEQLVDD